MGEKIVKCWSILMVLLAIVAIGAVQLNVGIEAALKFQVLLEVGALILIVLVLSNFFSNHFLKNSRSKQDWQATFERLFRERSR